MVKTLTVFFDPDNDANKVFFRNIQSGRYFFPMIFPLRTKTSKRKIKTANRGKRKIDPNWVAKQLGADIIDLNLIDKINFAEFTLYLELGTDFREEDGKIIFWKDERSMTFSQNRILKITDRAIAGKILWPK